MSRLIRYANVNDSEILGKIHADSSQAGFKGIIPEDILHDVFSMERRTKRFFSELSEGSPITAVIFENNEPAGLITFGNSRYANNDTPCIEIWRVYITPKFWGSGIAKELIEWGINEVRKENVTTIELWVLEENIRAKKFYEKIGFKHDYTIQTIRMGHKELKEVRYIKVYDNR